MRYDTSSAACIHPSIDALADLIKSPKKKSADEVTNLRTMCQRKIRSYREDVYIKRYTTPPEQDAARSRWQVVTQFANGMTLGIAKTTAR